MHRRLITILPVLILAILLANCKKDTPRSSAKSISTFAIQASVNAYLPNDINGVIVGDSIYLPDPSTISLVDRTPTITYSGAAISPAANARQDFSKPVTYTVTAADGTTISYVVVPRLLSGSKNITAFFFKAADNPGLAADLTGTITGDSIIVHADSTATVGNLVPAITYTGTKISPASGVKQDFSGPVTYTVTAQDGSTATYTVVVSYDRFLYVGSDNGNLYALDAATGSEVWQFKTGGAIRSSPTVAGGIVYFLSSDTYLYAIHSADGSLAWKYQAQPDGQPTDYGSNPTVSNGIVYINTSAYLVAVNAATGAQIWQNYIDFYSNDNSPTVVDGVVYDPTFNGGGPVVAFDAATGSLIRNYTGGIGRGNPAVVNGVVYATDENHLLDAWDAQTGALLFGFFISTGNGTFAGPGNSPTYYAGKVYIGGAAGVFALDAASGTLLWQNNTGGVGASPPVAGDNLVFVTSSTGYLIAYDAIVGVEQWSIPGVFTNTGNPTFANSTIYLGATDGTIMAITASTGQKKWTFSQSGAVYSGACIVDGSGQTFHPTASGDQQ